MTKKKLFLIILNNIVYHTFFVSPMSFNKENLNQKFLEGYAKKEYHPKTAQNYFMSLPHFYSFSLTEKPGITVSNKKLNSLRDKVSRKSSAFRQNLRQTTLRRDGRRFLRHDNFRSNKTV